MTPRVRLYMYLWLNSTVVGYVDVADESGYLLVAKGGADAGAKWRYRIVCRDGAFVREGVELTSRNLFNLPCQSIVEVSVMAPELCRVAASWVAPPAHDSPFGRC